AARRRRYGRNVDVFEFCLWQRRADARLDSKRRRRVGLRRGQSGARLPRRHSRGEARRRSAKADRCRRREQAMSLDPLLLSRIQCAFTVSFHIIFPAFRIGLAAWLATMEGMRLATGNPVYRRLFDFWIKIFAVSFGMGVVSGIVMAFQFGTNWSVLAEKTGP